MQVVSQVTKPLLKPICSDYLLRWCVAGSSRAFHFPGILICTLPFKHQYLGLVEGADVLTSLGLGLGLG